MMARKTGEQAVWDSLLTDSYNRGLNACNEFYGMPWDIFYEGSEHPELKLAFHNGWNSKAKELENEQ